QRRFGQMIKWVNQGLSGIKEAKVLGIESFFVDAYSENNKGYTSARRTLLTVTEMPRLFFEAVAVGGLLIVVLVMLAQNRDLKSVLPTIAIFAAAAFRLMPAMTRIVKTTNMIKHFRPSFDVVFCDLRRFEGAATREDERGTPPPIPFHSAIELRGLGFRYSPESPPVLEDLDLCVEKNRTVAFVGPSGTGKTTLVDIILGLLPPSEGQVLVDGTDVQENMSAWQRTIGYIPQVIFLMDDTIRRNVAFGVPDDRIDDEDIWRALASAQLDEFARGLPEGLESMVGESGVRLSGGQRQRVGIARALYRDPDVLIFDEATSSLDQETELEINQTLSRLGGNKTILIIAHRLKTVESCDHIFFLKDGLLAASGTFGELLESSPEFRRMAGMDLQSAGAGS
ncbi:MAG: ABC transporter ATP-binding protein, partial [Planctomycetota bacterium]